MVTSRQGVAAGAVVLMVLLAGCGGIAGGGPTISSPEAEVIDGTPAITFDYSVDDYATVLLESPEGEVINRDTIEPDSNTSALAMGTPSEGTYKLVLQTDGETAAEESITFNGSDPSVRSVTPVWSGNTLQEVEVQVQNSGDLPVQISGVEIAATDSTAETGEYQWVGPDSEATVTASPSFQTIEVTEPGEVRGRVTVNTSAGKISGSFTDSFEGANISVADSSMTWEGDTLTQVTATIENTGDLPATVEPEVRRGSETLASSAGKEIPAGESVEFEITGWAEIYQASSGGNVSLSLVANSSAGFDSAELEHYIEPAGVNIVNMSPQWTNGKLTAVTFTVQNTGEAEADFSMSLTAAGTEVGTASGTLEGGTQETYTYEAGYGEFLAAATKSETIPVTVSVTSGGETDSVTDSKEFDGLSTSFSDVDTTLYSQYDSNEEELTAVTFNVENTGDTMLFYDSVQISVGGETRTASLTFETSLSPGEDQIEYISLPEAILLSPGDHQVEITLLSNGDEVTTETTTVSVGE